MTMFDDLLRGVTPSPGRAEKGCQLRAREIDGNTYIRLEDVVELLTINDVLPKALAQFRRRLS